MAEREGFEPSIQVVPVYWFSKPAPSASRPPFQNLSLPPGGGGRIRTFGGREPSAVFKTAALGRSATPPESEPQPEPILRDPPIYVTGARGSRAKPEDCPPRSALDPPRELLLRDPLDPPHVRAQRLGNPHRPVALLELLEDGHHRPPDGHPAPVERVREPGLPLLVAIAQPDTPRLEVLAVRHRRDLAEGVLPRTPHLDVVRLRGGEPHVAGAEQRHAVVQPQPAEHLARVVEHLLVLRVALLRLRDLHQLHLVELVLADEAAGVLARGARLGPEAGRPCAVRDRQDVRLQDLAPVQVRERDLGRGGEVERGLPGR